MKRLFKDFASSLQWYLTLFISLIVICATALLLLIPSSLYRRQFLEQTIHYCKNMTEQIAVSLNMDLQSFDTTIRNLVTDKAFIHLWDQDLTEENAAYHYLHILSDLFPPSSMLAYYIEGTDLYLKSPMRHLKYGHESVLLDEPFNSEIYHTAMRTPLLLSWKVNQETGLLNVTRILYDPETYKVTGMLVFSLSQDFLRDKFNIHNTMEIEDFYIMDQSKTVLCTTEDKKAGEIWDLPLKKDSGKVYVEETKTLITAYSITDRAFFRYPYRTWCIVMQINKDILLSDFNRTLLRFQEMAFIFILGGITFGIFFSKDLAKPIIHLATKMEQVQLGNLDVRVIEKSPFSEIRTMNYGFNSMVEQLNKLINTIYRSELEKKDAQLKALQAQINPHFLFNTMQLISWKANEYEAYPVCDMVRSLSFMLETTLGRNVNQTFSLREELEYLHNYAKIIHYKYQDNIVLLFDVPEEYLDFQIPVLILQPFIENAVVHGLAPKPEGGTVKISAKRERDDLVFTIADDGLGISSDILRMLQEDDTKEKKRGSSYHIALLNIKSRITLLYGSAYGYHIESSLRKGTTVSLRLPCLKTNTLPGDSVHKEEGDMNI